MDKQEQINAIMLKVDGELDDQATLLMSKFLQSIQDEPIFEKIMDLLERFPSVLENFAKCFQDKVNFFKQQDASDWDGIVKKEQEVLESIPGEEVEE